MISHGFSPILTVVDVPILRLLPGSVTRVLPDLGPYISGVEPSRVGIYKYQYIIIISGLIIETSTITCTIKCHTLILCRRTKGYDVVLHHLTC